jgi:hypothetical protein
MMARKTRVPMMAIVLGMTVSAFAAETCTMIRGAFIAKEYANMVRLQSLFASRDVRDAFAIPQMMNSGRAAQLPKGTEVLRESTPLANGLLQVRLPGTNEVYWTTTDYISCPR